MRQIEGLISEGVLQGVRTMLPVKSILREYLAAEDTESEYESDSDSEEEEEEEAPLPDAAVDSAAVVNPVKLATPKLAPLEAVEPPVLNLEAKGVQFVETGPAPKLITAVETGPAPKLITAVETGPAPKIVQRVETGPAPNAEEKEEELIFTDINTDDIGFDDGEDVKTGLTGLNAVEDTAFDFEEIA
jgi:hypothetical protein